MKIFAALKWILYALFGAGLLLTLSVPFRLTPYMRFTRDMYASVAEYNSFILVFLLAVGGLGLWIIAELIMMVRTTHTDPFVLRNAKALRRIGYVAMGIAVLFFMKYAFYPTLLTALCGGMLTLLSLFALALAQLFWRAALLIEDSDLTI